MALDFPAGPSNGQTFTNNSTTWTWDGTKWSIITGGGGGGGTGSSIVQGNTTASVVDTGSDGRFVVTTEGSERLRVDPNGRLLVGTSAIENDNVAGLGSTNIVQIRGAATGAGLKVGNTADFARINLVRSASVGTGVELGTLSFGAETPTSVERARVSCFSETTGGLGGRGGRLVFSTTADGSANPTERMRIGATGNVAIGATNGGDYRLAVVAAGALSAASCTVDASGRTPLACINLASSGDSNFIKFFGDNYIFRGEIDYNRASGVVRYNTSSDARLKSNIEDSPSATSLLSALKVRSYNWNETGYKVDYGFVAQELHQVVPDAVKVGDSGEKVEDAWAVDYSKVVPVLTKALQEAVARIETLEAANTDLAARLTKLEGGIH